ncbi:NRAMP family divalent metal transporter [Solicola gregarius]|uniref:Divalent metal cation transporter n=1 Tax=Solicola gregarius TaxID=2908642 RepID=A0AA46TK62_9ACTN|nr:NRAMP family divalent metal transporter [Solicola gregarius]UYM05933.1 divalent metal cation transporter [Solicola gregarius]
MSTNEKQDGSVVASATTRSAILGAVFLMATSAIGPGFITQTTEFTVRLGAAFAFAIVVSIVIDIAVQLNVWRVIGVAGKRAHEIANEVLPGLGYLLTALIVLGGLVFNIGNTAGTGLGADAMLGLEPKVGGAISAAIAIAIFLSKRAGVALDRIVVVLGVLMIALTAYVALTSSPPVGEAIRESVVPYDSGDDFLVITTIIGGTVGGYITYAGAHRLLDSGVSGVENVRNITRSSVTSILVTGVMRILLFLAILGVVAGGVDLAAGNPTASAFESATGEAGMRLFGIILWAASITSVIGASYTSVSFLTVGRTSPRLRNLLTVAFILVTCVIYLLIGTAPVKLLLFAGAFNGLILPVGFGALLWAAWRRRDLLRGYTYPIWLLVVGLLAWLVSAYLAYEAMKELQNL